MSVDWIDAAWPAPSNIRAGTTRRHGGVSKGMFATLNLGDHVGDDAIAVAENRRRFVDECALPSEPIWLKQTHSTNVAVDAAGGGATGRPNAESDALVTRTADRVCAMLSADCLPVVFASTGGDEVAVAHAGWRGLCGGILEATVAEMKTAPADILAWIGPAISKSAFEVGVEVRQQFVLRDAAADRYIVENANGRYQADLAGLAKCRLKKAGVDAVYGGELCTLAGASEFFSYRRDGPTGRMATFVYYT